MSAGGSIAQRADGGGSARGGMSDRNLDELSSIDKESEGDERIEIQMVNNDKEKVL